MTRSAAVAASSTSDLSMLARVDSGRSVKPSCLSSSVSRSSTLGAMAAAAALTR